MKPALRIVPPSAPSPREKVLMRVRKHPRPEGALMCPECGSRTSVTVKAGEIVKNGRKQGGTLIVDGCCAGCWTRGRLVPMRSGAETLKVGK